MAVNLNRREKLSVALAGGFVLVFIVLQFVVFPVIDKRKALDSSILIKKKELENVLVMKAEYESIVKSAEISSVQYAKRQKNFTLFSFLDNLAGQAGIKEHITYMKPSKTESKDGRYKISKVEMKLSDLSMEQLAPYIYMIESSDNVVYIKRISITKAETNKEVVNVILQAETLEV